MRLPLTTIERGLAITGLLFYTGAFAIFPDVIQSLLRYGVWLLILALLGIRWKKALYTASRNPALLVLTLLIVISFLWSIFPGESLYQGREIFQSTTLALYIASRFSPSHQMNLLTWVMGIAMVVSVVVSFAVPSIGIHMDGDAHDGAWRGIFYHKNYFASLMLVAYQVFLLQALYERRQRWLYWLGCGTAVGLILLSTSKTALTIALLLTLFIMFYRNLRIQGKSTVIVLLIFGLVLGCVAIVVFSNWTEILTSLGRDPTLTGRVPIWNYAISKLAERPLLGYGFGAFWAAGSQYAIEAGIAAAGSSIDVWIPPHAHNGFIDIALSVGLSGLLLFMVSILMSYAYASKRGYRAKAAADLFPLTFLIYFAMNNLTESYIFSFNWVLFAFTALSLQQVWTQPAPRSTDVVSFKASSLS